MDVCEPQGHSHRKRLYTDALSEPESNASEDTAYSVCGDILIGHITLTATENVEETQRKYLYFVSALASPCYARLRDLWLSIRLGMPSSGLTGAQKFAGTRTVGHLPCASSRSDVDTSRAFLPGVRCPENCWQTDSAHTVYEGLCTIGAS